MEVLDFGSDVVIINSNVTSSVTKFSGHTENKECIVVMSDSAVVVGLL